jgi:GH15 family glucan-1,4-alpha-glucosidase
MASKIEDYGLIGNTRTAALVSRSGSIDWLCAPRFDSDACFASLVGYDEHGSWGLRPAVRVRESKQRYRENSMVLETDLIMTADIIETVSQQRQWSRTGPAQHAQHP